MSAALRGIVRILLLAAIGWAALTLAYIVPGPGWLAQAVAWMVGLGAAATLFLLRPFARGVGAGLAVFGLVLVWFFALQPSNTGTWQPDVSQLAWGEVKGDLLTLHNVRDFTYRSETDFTEHWETRTYDLSKLNGLDLFLSHWGSPMIAHTIMSWDFSNGQHLAISIETRKVVGQEYSAVGGFFRQYPIYYVVADERDVIGVRTNFRGEDVWLYRLRAPAGGPRALLLDYVASMNALVETPQWYNALVDNCTTSIRRHVRHLDPGRLPLDWRLLVNGYLDQMLYERGRIDTSLPFEKLRDESNIDARAKAAGMGPEFSTRIRQGLPDPRSASGG